MIPTGPAPLLRPFTLKGADQLGTRRSTCRSTVATSLTTLVALLLVVAVITLVAWALQLMQAATDRQEFSLMLAGCMVCSAAVGLATVMVITLTGPAHQVLGPAGHQLWASDSLLSLSEGPDGAILQDLPESFVLPWDGQL